MNLKRIQRLLKLLTLLQSGRERNAQQLAFDCQVSKRTIFRDLDVLREAGVPLVFNQESQRYHVPGSYFLPPTNFTAQEALSVLVLCHELGGAGRLPFYQAARTAAVKLENSLPSALRDYLRSVSSSLQIRIGAKGRIPEQHGVYEELLDAIARRRCVRIEYDSVRDGEAIRTKLSPYQLLFSRHSWYVIGRSSVHRETRTFHVGRILKLEPLEDKYTVPKGFTLKRYLRNAWHLIPDSGPDHEVCVRFASLVARNVSEVVWHPTQRVERLADGALDFRATVSGLWEISWWILGYGDQAEVISPPELRQMVAERVNSLAKKYGAG